MAWFAADRARRVTQTDRWLAGLLGAEAGVALVAAGGYARRELLPGSDLDLVLLHDGRPDISALADRIWYPVWDSGTRLDHAVRTPDQARAVARADLRVALGLLPARHVAGDAELTTRLRLGVLADWRAAAGTRLAELQAMHRERAGRSGELAFLLEPDLKEARGGLRDVDAITAIAAAWVAPGPGPRVRAAHGLLLDTRHALHEVTGRAGDRLVLQEQAESPGCWNCRTPARCCAAWPGPGGPSLMPWINRSGRPSAAGRADGRPAGCGSPARRQADPRPGQLAALPSAWCPRAAGLRQRAGP